MKRLNTQFKFLVTLSVFAISALFSGCTNISDPTTGTGTAVLIGGGGAYASVILQMKSSVRWTLGEIAKQAGAAATLCESRDSLSATQREFVRNLLKQNAAAAVSNVDRTEVEFTKVSLDDHGLAVRATVEKTSTGFRVRIRESSYSSNEAWFLLVHELLHTATVLDDLATPAQFPTGMRAALDTAGQCAEDLWLKLSNPAELDPTFGAGGVVVSPTVFSSRILASLPDGGHLAVTQVKRVATEAGEECRITKLRANLTVDPSFGTGGYFQTPKTSLPVTTTAADAAQATKVCTSILLQSDGKILVAGTETVPNWHSLALLFRLTADGRPDPLFHSGTTFFHSFDPATPNGLWNPSRGGGIQALAIDKNGRILASGWRAYADASGFQVDGRLARITPDGQLDVTFNGTGISAALDAGLWGRAYRLAIQADGKIVTLGHANDASNQYSNRLTLARLQETGVLDASFGTGGKLSLDTGLPTNPATDIISQDLSPLPDGRLLVAARTGYLPGHGDPGYLLIRLKPDGGLDTTFGVSGRVSFFAPDANTSVVTARYGRAMIVPLDHGRVALAGHYLKGDGFHGLLVGIDDKGRLDPTFKNAEGASKFIEFSIGGLAVQVASSVPQPDGRFLVYGIQRNSEGEERLFVARFAGSSAP